MKDTGGNQIERAKPGRKPSNGLTEHQARTLDAIRTFVSDQGLPPTVSELAEVFGITTASMHDQISQLVRKGYLRRLPGKARGLVIADEPLDRPAELVSIPIVGCVAAGTPLLAEENIIGEISVDSGMLSSGTLFGLAVKGDSMIDAGINDGDTVVVRMQPVAESGTIIVALFGDEATVKRLYYRDDVVELRPQNPRLQSMTVGPEDDMRILGKVVAVSKQRVT